MVTQAYAQEAAAPAEEHVEAPAADATHAEDAAHAEDGAHADPTADTHATTEAHGDDHGSGVFPPFDPATFPSQLLWLAITFAALYFLMSRVALPRIGSILETRRTRIEGDLKEAERLRQETPQAAKRRSLRGRRLRESGALDRARCAEQQELQRPPSRDRRIARAELVELRAQLLDRR